MVRIIAFLSGVSLIGVALFFLFPKRSALMEEEERGTQGARTEERGEVSGAGGGETSGGQIGSAQSEGGGSPHTPGQPPARRGVSFMERVNQAKARVEKNPKDVEALIFLGNANFDIQRYEKAKEFYHAALEVDPMNVFARTDLATVYKNTGEIDQAVAELRKVLTIDPNHQVALFNLGVILLSDKNDVEGAIKSWEQLVRVNPTDPASEDIKKKIAELKGTRR